jgi:hypothetical protein
MSGIKDEWVKWMTRLHDHVHQPRLALLLSRQTWNHRQYDRARMEGRALTIDSIDILLEDRTIPLPLHFRKPDVDVDLFLCIAQSLSHLKPEKKSLTGQ